MVGIGFDRLGLGAGYRRLQEGYPGYRSLTGKPLLGRCSLRDRDLLVTARNTRNNQCLRAFFDFQPVTKRGFVTGCQSGSPNVYRGCLRRYGPPNF